MCRGRVCAGRNAVIMCLLFRFCVRVFRSSSLSRPSLFPRASCSIASERNTCLVALWERSLRRCSLPERVALRRLLGMRAFSLPCPSEPFPPPRRRRRRPFFSVLLARTSAVSWPGLVSTCKRRKPCTPLPHFCAALLSVWFRVAQWSALVSDPAHGQEGQDKDEKSGGGERKLSEQLTLAYSGAAPTPFLRTP